MSYSNQHTNQLIDTLDELAYNLDTLNSSIHNIQYSLNCLNARLNAITIYLHDNKTHIIYQNRKDYEEMPFDF